MPLGGGHFLWEDGATDIGMDSGCDSANPTINMAHNFAIPSYLKALQICDPHPSSSCTFELYATYMGICYAMM